MGLSRENSLRLPGAGSINGGLPIRGFGPFPEPKPGSLPGVPGFPVPAGAAMHPGTGMMHYGAVFPWPKLIQQRY